MQVVLTGGPCIGKSTLINMLEQYGFPVIHEVATDVINDGGPLPWVDHEAFQHEVLQRQMTAERRLAQASPLFLDRGAFDGIPYRQIYGRNVPDFFSGLEPRRYDVCFLLDQLPWEDDGLRYEDPTFTTEIQPYFGRVYSNNDIPVIAVPVAEPLTRLKFILDIVGKALGRDLTASLRQRLGATVSDDRKERRWFSIPSLGANTGSVPSLAMASVS